MHGHMNVKIHNYIFVMWLSPKTATPLNTVTFLTSKVLIQQPKLHPRMFCLSGVTVHWRSMTLQGFDLYA